MAKETNMKTIKTEVKDIAKAVGASLRRSGHAVPHSVVLHALAAALDKRDWHKLKATLSATEPTVLAAPVVAETAGSTSKASSLSPFALMMLRLAYVIGRPVSPLPDDEAAAVAQAAEAIGNSIVGTLTFKDLSSPATLLGETGSFLVASDKMNERGVGQLSFATFEFNTPHGSFTAASRYAWPNGWALDTQYLAPFQQELEAAVPYAMLAGAGVAKARGPRVRAEFWTDDHRVEVKFDATAYFEQADADTLLSIAEVGFSGDYNTDSVAEYISDRNLNQELVDGFDYLHALQKANLREPVGFECRVNSDDFYRWMDKRHRKELAQWLCVRDSVELLQFHGEPAWLDGMWDWRAMDGRESEQSHATQEDAAVDAYLKLGLLQAALDGRL